MRRILYFGSPQSVHDIKWASFFADKEGFEVYFTGEEQFFKDFQSLKVRFKEEYNIHLLSPIQSFSLSNPFALWSSVSMLRSHIRINKIDLMQVLFSAPFALWTMFVSIPTIITNRGSDVLREIPKLKNSGLKGALFLKLFAMAFNKSTITATSNKQLERINELFGISEGHLIRTGVDVEKISDIATNCNKPGKKIILSPRYFSPIYNIKVQIDAIALLPKDVIDQSRFIFIKGKSYDESYASELVAQLNRLQIEVGLSYEILEHLSQDDIFKLYGQASLVVMTPVSDGTPNSALEAMSAKCPLIIPQLPYDKDLFEKVCFIYHNDGHKALAELIVEALANYPNELLLKAYEGVSKFGNRKVEMNKLQNIYLELVQKEVDGE